MFSKRNIMKRDFRKWPESFFLNLKNRSIGKSIWGSSEIQFWTIKVPKLRLKNFINFFFNESALKLNFSESWNWCLIIIGYFVKLEKINPSYWKNCLKKLNNKRKNNNLQGVKGSLNCPWYEKFNSHLQRFSPDPHILPTNPVGFSIWNFLRVRSSVWHLLHVNYNSSQE